MFIEWWSIFRRALHRLSFAFIFFTIQYIKFLIATASSSQSVSLDKLKNYYREQKKITKKSDNTSDKFWSENNRTQYGTIAPIWIHFFFRALTKITGEVQLFGPGSPFQTMDRTVLSDMDPKLFVTSGERVQVTVFFHSFQVIKKAGIP